jgi:RHS repeat-associated protein
LQPNGTSTTTYQYDMAGRLISTTNPDSGTFASTACPVVAGEPGSPGSPPLPANVSDCYTYDQDGNMTESMDARGSADTVLTAYDGLNRPISRGSDTYTYDSTSGGNVGVGRLTSETFAGGGLSGSQSYVYDARGRQTSTTLTVGSNPYPSSSTYDDANRVLTQTYPDGETVTNSYGVGDSQSFLSGVNTSIQTRAKLLSYATYTGTGGAEGAITSAIWGQTTGATYTYSAAFDLLGRATDINVKNGSLTVMFDQARTFDAGGNVSTIDTTLTAGTDNQAFCYDEQNRLTAAASSGTLPSGCPTFSAGTLTAANYNQSFAVNGNGQGADNMGRLQSGPLGTYAYGDSAHVDAVTAIGSQYTAVYDAAGNMTCQAPSSATTCVGTQTGAQLSYNNQGQLSGWQSQPGATTTTGFLYDGQGNRVAQMTTGSGDPTTVYVGDVEEDTIVNGVTTTKTTYYYANGQRFAMSVNGTISYLATDGLGSADVTLDANGNVVASQLYAPYGSLRYSSGTMPTDYGFTGQHSDVATGLDYYGARYYDPVAGQFISADSFLPGNGYDIWGLSRYAYVENNPIIRTDPTGHVLESGPVGGCDQTCDPASFAKTVADKITGFLNWATSPGVQKVNHGVSGVLDTWWNALSGASPPGFLSDHGLGPSMRDPLANLDRILGGNESSTSEYRTGQLVTSVSQFGLVLTPEGATEEGASLLEDAAAACGGESFSGGSRVMLASGATVAISQLWPGAQVLATNPQTGKTQREAVDKVWVNHDIDLMDVVVDTAHGQGTIDSTANHLFWDLTTRKWTEAGQLHTGDRLFTPDGQFATVARTVSVPGAEEMWDLTVANDHDFYVVTVDTAVLVHNCPSLSLSGHVVDKMAERGWTPESIQDIVADPAADTHPVWDLNTEPPQPATAYAASDNTYVVVNDASREVIQVSNTNDPDWQPVWNDAKFQR